ncbi:MAG: twin-arginine translocase TatA/TatE family subunit [Balneolaceae bacterium]
MGLGGFEWLIILLVIVFLFGAKRIPGLAKGLGQGFREFKKAKDSDDSELEDKREEDR